MEKPLDKDTSIRDYMTGKISGDEYTSMLESTIELLKAEVETLREKIAIKSGIHESVTFDKNLVSAMHYIYRSEDASQIVERIHEIINSRISISESNIFILNNSHKLEKIAEVFTDSNLSKIIDFMETEGITDWVMNLKEPKVLSDPESAQSSLKKIVLLPLYLGTNSFGILALLTASDSDVKPTLLSELMIIAEYTALLADNQKNKIEISNMNERFKKLGKKVRDADAMVSNNELVGSISIELNLPLQIIDSNIQLIESGIGNPTIRAKVIKEQVTKISSLNHKLIELSNEQSFSKSKQQIDLFELFEEILVLTGSQLQRDGIVIECKTAESGLVIDTYKTQIEQAILSILLHSRDRLPDGGKIYVNFAKNKKLVELSIKHEGVGLSEDEVKYINSDYEASEFDKSTKLIAVAKDKILHSGGSFDIETDTAKGTLFLLSFARTGEIS